MNSRRFMLISDGRRQVTPRLKETLRGGSTLGEFRDRQESRSSEAWGQVCKWVARYEQDCFAPIEMPGHKLLSGSTHGTEFDGFWSGTDTGEIRLRHC
jgi:hypothetical protein